MPDMLIELAVPPEEVPDIPGIAFMAEVAGVVVVVVEPDPDMVIDCMLEAPEAAADGASGMAATVAGTMARATIPRVAQIW